MQPNGWFIYFAILLLMISVVLTRAGYWLFGHYLPLPAQVRRALRYAPVAGLVAIIVPEILPWQAGLGPVFDLKLVAAILAMVVFWLTRSAVLLIVSGTAALWFLRMWLV